MHLAIVSLAARGNDEVAVLFEISDGEHVQKESLLLGVADIADLGLRVGDSTREAFDLAFERAELRNAIKRGAGFLGYGGCSPRALARKMTSKGIDPEVAERAVSELMKRGYLDPQADAIREAEKCVGKLWGVRRIVSELRAKGYDDTAVKGALYALEDNEVDFTEICAERLRRTVSRLPDDPAQKRKLVASLERYGFSMSEIKEAVGLAFKK